MDAARKYRLGIMATHPVQYTVPWYRALAAHPRIDLQVYYAHRQTPQGQAQAGFGVPFEWDLPLDEAYPHHFLTNRARHPGTDRFFGGDTPEIGGIIARERFDAFLVSGWYVKSFWQAMRACWKTGTPLMVRGDSQLATARSPLRRLLKYVLYRRFILRFDAYLVVGQRAKEYLLHYGAAEQKMFAVPHAVDNHFFSQASSAFRAEKERWRKEWGIPPDALVFLFAGKLLARKRPMDFFRALREARPSSPRAWGLIAGDGPLRLELERYAGAHDLPVRFAGFLNQTAIPKAYAAADALVLPSDGLETWGLVVNEAMACGLPAVVSDAVGCGPDLVAPWRTGAVFACGDIPALAQILKTLANDPERLRGMGEAARLKIADNSIDRAVEGTVAAVRAVYGSIRRGLV